MLMEARLNWLQNCPSTTCLLVRNLVVASRPIETRRRNKQEHLHMQADESIMHINLWLIQFTFT
jgi:hypothetical protein